MTVHLSKVCSNCKEEKPSDHFWGRTTPKGTKTLNSWCKACCGSLQYKQSKNSINKVYYHGRRKSYYKTNPLKYLWSIAKKRAKKNNLEFDIEPEDIIFTGFCPVTNVKLDVSTNKLHNSISLDRKDNSKGYVKGNVFAISRWANLRKSDMCLDDLKRMVKYVEST